MGIMRIPHMSGWRADSAWIENIGSFSYDSKSKDVSAEESGTGAGLAFSVNGDKMYVAGFTTNTVFQYALSTAWDVSTASYESKSKDVSAESTRTQGVFFKPDGTSMYVVHDGAVSTDSAVYQYTLSTPWDVSTASYASKSKDVSSESGNTRALWFRSDGAKMYITEETGVGTEIVYQYTLSTPWDVSTASYDSKSFATSTQTTVAEGIAFSPDGTQMLVLDNAATDAIYQYSLSTAWDVSTASYASKSLSPLQATNNLDVAFKPSGERFFVYGSGDVIYQYSL